MKLKPINPGIFEIEVIVKEIKYGNTVVDKFTGWDKIEATTLKLRCIGCTVMVFKEDMKLFNDISVGDSFSAVVKEWKEKVYNFKKFINNGIVKGTLTDFDEPENDFDPYHSDFYEEDNWLRDAAGTDDPETMNDVYWNLD